MIPKKDSSNPSSILESLLLEEEESKTETLMAQAHPSREKRVTPHWHVEEAQEASFVNDFFSSHTNKVLGI